MYVMSFSQNLNSKTNQETILDKMARIYRYLPNSKFLYYFIVIFTLFGLLLQWRLIGKIESQTARMFAVVEPNQSFKELRPFEPVERRCKPPSPDPMNDDVLPFMTDKVAPAKCVVDNPKSNKMFNGVAFVLKSGNYLHRVVDLGVPCCMKNIVRDEETDGIRPMSNKCFPITKGVTKIKKTSEYFSVECRDESSGDLVYAEGFHAIHKKEKPISSTPRDKLNVVFFAMEATSQLNFIRKMPLSYDYLRNDLKGLHFSAYNKVGECTHTNIIPILAGISTAKFNEECVNAQKRMNVAPKLDNCSLIWNKFSEKGYITHFGEDYSRWGPFDFYWPKTWRKKPTDYYLRPVALYADTHEGYYSTDFVCVGPRFGYEVLIENVKTVAEVNADKPFFQLVWPGSLGYRDMNNQQRGDEILLSGLKYFKETGLINKTVIFVVGDHGFRKKGYKFTRIGAIEDRMPIAFIVLPEWLKSSYSKLYTNMEANSKLMISHYDMHKTLLDILHFGEDESVKADYPETGTSLFKPIPSDRTCLDAGIPLLWCLPCHPRQTLEEDVKLEVADFLLDKLNTGIQLCDPFVFNYQNYKIKSILFASKWDPRDVQRELCSRDGKDVILPGYYGQSPMTLNIPCVNFFKEADPIEIVSVEFATEVTNATFMGEVVRYLNYTDRKWHYHLTEDVQYNYINQQI